MGWLKTDLKSGLLIKYSHTFRASTSAFCHIKENHFHSMMNHESLVWDILKTSIVHINHTQTNQSPALSLFITLT